MADTLEFTNLALPLRPLRAGAARSSSRRSRRRSIEVDGDNLIVRHCYVERRMTPAQPLPRRARRRSELEHAVREYGDAIRELAIANVFPGDLLWRNFGVNRHGRVVFYDYDEIEYLTDCAFRAHPAAAEPRGRARERAVVPGRAARRLPGGVRDVPARRARGCARRSCATTPTCSQPEFWQECQRRVAARRDRRLLPVSRVAPVLAAVRADLTRAGPDGPARCRPGRDARAYGGSDLEAMRTAPADRVGPASASWHVLERAQARDDSLPSARQAGGPATVSFAAATASISTSSSG